MDQITVPQYLTQHSVSLHKHNAPIRLVMIEKNNRQLHKQHLEIRVSNCKSNWICTKQKPLSIWGPMWRPTQLLVISSITRCFTKRLQSRPLKWWRPTTQQMRKRLFSVPAQGWKWLCEREQNEPKNLHFKRYLYDSTYRFKKRISPSTCSTSTAN